MKHKSIGSAYLFFLLAVIGIFGIHRFYLGKIGTGVLYFFTFGLFGLGPIYDVFTLPKQVRVVNEEISRCRKPVYRNTAPGQNH